MLDFRQGVKNQAISVKLTLSRIDNVIQKCEPVHDSLLPLLFFIGMVFDDQGIHHKDDILSDVRGMICKSF
jgi:hypothetical protein